ncbi:MAG: urea ABC transporter permease subunit UrtB [Desulfovibrio sp.]|jgi:urea transport system permease protein|nr:urea ABC transporter permease subunit UrtB [Desulfovibrio sp.]
MFNCRRAILCICLLIFLPLRAYAAAELTLAPETLESLKSARVTDRNRAIEDLGRILSENASTLLQALRDGALYVDKEDDSLIILEADGQKAADAVSGTALPAPDKSRLRKVGTSNSQREAITGFLSGRLLRHPDADTRLRALENLLERSQTDKNLLLSLLRDEKDPRIRQRLEGSLALLSARDPASSPAELLRAVEILRDEASPKTRQVLEELQKGRDPAVAAAADKALYTLRVTADRVSMLETLFFGLSLGSILVLTSIGLAVTFGVMGVINMAHGELVMLGAYTVWGMQQLLPGRPGLALLLSVPAAFLVSGSTGALLERCVIRHLYGRPLETLLATFGVSLILQQAVRTLISPMNRAVESPEFMSGMLHITGNFSLTCNRIYVICFCLGVFILIYAIMHKTRLGLEVRAVTQNRPIARSLGVNASAVDSMTFALGSGVAGMAGAALSQLTNVGPNLGQGYIVDSFLVVVFGGVGNLWGTLCGGLILGLVNKILEPVSGAMLAKIILLAGVILFMQAKPKGLFPERGRAAEN